MSRATVEDEIATVARLCRELGLGDVAPVLLKAAHHTTLRVAPLNLVARVQSAQPVDMAWDRATREIAVARHLAARDAPAIAPHAGLAGPHVTGNSVVTFWPYAEHARTADEGDAALAAASLAALHRALRDYPGPLPSFTQALDRCWTVLADDSATPALSQADRHLLKSQFQRHRGVVKAAAANAIPLHGDAHPGNLLLGGPGPRWLDFEEACLGPREYDIACLPTAAWRHFADADPALIQTCADLKSVCVAVWCAADPSRSAEVREAAAYHLHRVRALAV